MVELVYGGSGSGKSAYAENRVLALAGCVTGSGCATHGAGYQPDAGCATGAAAPERSLKKYYVATMIPYGEDGAARVQRHQNLRAGKGFTTFEQPRSLGDLVLPEPGVVLVECLGNLTANEMFRDDQVMAKTAVVDAVVSGVVQLLGSGRVEHCVLVSNNVFEDGITYDETTRAYMEAMGSIHMKIAEMADRVTEVVCGIPLVLKDRTEEDV